MTPGAKPFALEALAINKRFGVTHVLKDADLRIKHGEVHALLGGNGAGKSTLIRIISGSHSRDGGTILFDGQENLTPTAIAVVFQELALLPHMSVAENIYLPHHKRGLEIVRLCAGEKAAAEALALIDGTLARDTLTRLVAELDLHERQLVEIARALSSGARLLLLDEPTANLTLAETERLFRILRRLAERGISILIVSHRMSEIRAVADVCTVLRDGHTVLDRVPLAELSDEAIVQAMGQSEGSAQGLAGAPMADIGGATVAISSNTVSLRLDPGTILGLAGAPIGPTTLIDALVGAARSDKWKIAIDGSGVDFAKPAEAVRSGVGYVSGDRAEKGIIATLPLLDNVVAAARVARRRLLTSWREAHVAKCALERLSMKVSSVDALPQTLSGGTQQKLLLARWIENMPRVLVLEEPTRGVDIGTKREIYAIIREAAAAGSVVLWWSTEFSELAEVCSRVLAFDLRGEVSGVLSGEQVSEVALAGATGMAA